MRLLTRRATIRCKHETGGEVRQGARQGLVFIQGSPVLVRGDCLGKKIEGCVVTPPLKPCLVTMTETGGHSSLLRIRGRPVLLDTLDGVTSGDPPGTVHYRVADPGQALVQEK